MMNAVNICPQLSAFRIQLKELELGMYRNQKVIRLLGFNPILLYYANTIPIFLRGITIHIHLLKYNSWDFFLGLP